MEPEASTSTLAVPPGSEAGPNAASGPRGKRRSLANQFAVVVDDACSDSSAGAAPANGPSQGGTSSSVSALGNAALCASSDTAFQGSPDHTNLQNPAPGGERQSPGDGQQGPCALDADASSCATTTRDQSPMPAAAADGHAAQQSPVISGHKKAIRRSSYTQTDSNAESRSRSAADGACDTWYSESTAGTKHDDESSLHDAENPDGTHARPSVDSEASGGEALISLTAAEYAGLDGAMHQGMLASAGLPPSAGKQTAAQGCEGPVDCLHASSCSSKRGRPGVFGMMGNLVVKSAAVALAGMAGAVLARHAIDGGVQPGDEPPFNGKYVRRESRRYSE